MLQADMAELADALDLGSSGQPCRFKSCWPHTGFGRWCFHLSFFVCMPESRIMPDF